MHFFLEFIFCIGSEYNLIKVYADDININYILLPSQQLFYDLIQDFIT